MSKLDAQTARSISQALLSGTVPETGLEHFAVGLDLQMAEIQKGLSAVATGKSGFKFIRGDYGAGKTFLCCLAAAQAAQRGFVTSKVVISKGDTPLYKLEEVYKKLCAGLNTNGRTGLKPLLDSWLYNLEQSLIEVDGMDEDDPDFQTALDNKIDTFLSKVGDQAGGFASGVKTYNTLTVERRYQEARGILDWLSGSSQVATSVKSQAGIKGDLKRQDVFGFLKAVLEIIRQSSHKGLFLVLDEVETVLRERSDLGSRGLEVLRQLVDALHQNEFEGLYVMFTGTPEFFERERGVPLEPALDQRIRVEFKDNEPDNLRQPQIRLTAFDHERLLLVADRVREIYKADHPERVREKVDDEFRDQLVEQFTTAFGGKVSVTPRLFLRELVHQMDLVDQYADYDPKEKFAFDLEDLKSVKLSDVEQESLGGVCF